MPLDLWPDTVNIFYDCEFTKLQQPFDPEPNELISIGCVSESGKTFYAENATTLARPHIFSEFVVENVVPLLEGGDVAIPYIEIAHQLKAWVESFDGEVKLWSDAPYFDWQHVKHMFDNNGWPANLVRKSAMIQFDSSIKQTRFDNALEQLMKSKSLRQHHALDDAKANILSYHKAMARF